MKPWIILIVVFLLVEFYAWQAVKTALDAKWMQRAYLIFSFLVVVFVAYSVNQFDRTQGQNPQSLRAMGLLLLVYLPKMILTIFLLSEDLYRLIFGGIQQLGFHQDLKGFLPERRKFVSQMALAIAAIPFSSVLYGIFIGRFDFRVMKTTLYFDHLPKSFDGFKILQLSDIHCGSFDNKEKIEYGVDLINQQEYDVMVFTGDLVNTLATEMDDWYEVFTKLKQPKFGKFSILGNHDYGEYIQWPSAEAKKENFEGIKAIHPKLGFDLLLNENRRIQKGEDSIYLSGVENWGAKFKKAGDLEKASQGLKPEDFKILLSHDPSHWELEVQNHPVNYHLTLSGHTHGMQFGIEIPRFLKWSPIQYIYKYWAGLYKKGSRYLYVNRGFGYHAYPGRVGIWPEITLIELRKK